MQVLCCSRHSHIPTLAGTRMIRDSRSGQASWDLAGFTSAIILAMIALLIGYEAVSRLVEPVPIHFAEAIPVAVLGLAVNVASAWLLSGGDHHGYSHGHGQSHHAYHNDDETHRIPTNNGDVALEVFEDG